LTGHLSKESLKGLRPFKTYPSPSPSKERGIKGVRLINNFKLDWLVKNG